MVWFIVAAILLYVVISFCIWGATKDFYFDIDKEDIVDIFKFSAFIWIGILAVVLLIVCIFAGVFQYLPNAME